MGTLTLVDLREEVLANLGNRDDITNTRLDRHLDLAQMRIARSREFEETKRQGVFVHTPTGTLDDDRFLDVGMTIREVYSLRITTEGKERKLVRIGQRKFDQLYPDTRDHTGNPKLYILWNNIIEFWPIPNATIELVLRWSIWPAAFTLTTQVSDLDEKDDLIISLATHTLFKSLKNKEGAAEWLDTYAQGLGESVREESEKPDLDLIPGPGVEDTSGSSSPWSNPFVGSNRAHDSGV